MWFQPTTGAKDCKNISSNTMWVSKRPVNDEPLWLTLTFGDSSCSPLVLTHRNDALIGEPANYHQAQPRVISIRNHKFFPAPSDLEPELRNTEPGNLARPQTVRSVTELVVGDAAVTPIQSLSWFVTRGWLQRRSWGHVEVSTKCACMTHR